MTMYAVSPIPFKPSMLVSSTAPEPTPLWVSGTTYAKDAEVIWANGAGDLRKWISAVNSNADTPGTSDKWVDNGPCNKCAMFDTKISTQTVAASPLIVEFEATDIISNLALLNLIGESVKIEMFSNDIKVYEETQNLNESEILDWWDYYFQADEQITRALFDNLPLYYSPKIKITLSGNANVAIGHAVFGPRFDLGDLGYGATSGIIDYSKKITDEFGDSEFVKRPFADEFSGQVLVENIKLNQIKRKLRELRAAPTLWVGVEEDRFSETLVVFGWYRQHRIAIPYPLHSLIDLEIEGLT
jgi:hypothetical protein